MILKIYQRPFVFFTFFIEKFHENSNRISMAYLILSIIFLTACPSRNQSSLPNSKPVPAFKDKNPESDEVTIADLWEALESQQNLDLIKISKLIENPSVRKDINVENQNRETALSLAINRKEWSIVEKLLPAGANPTLPDGDTLLTKYCSSETEGGQLRIFLTIPSVKKIINARNKNGKTALFLAVENWSFLGSNSLIKALFSAGADPNIPDKKERTILSTIYKKAIAADKTFQQAYNDFFDNKVDQSEMNAALMVAAPINELVKNLLKAGANPVLSDGDSILMKYIAGDGGIGPLLKIPSVKATIDLQNKGETAFSLAVKAKDWEAVDLLVSRGAKDTTALCSPEGEVPRDLPTSQTMGFRFFSGMVDEARFYYTALMICSLSGHAGGVRKLLKESFIARGINAENRKEETAFSLAVDGNHWEVMAELAKRDADTDYLCSPDKISDNISEEELLLNENKPYNILMICALSGHQRGVNKLLENPTVKVHINNQNKDGETAFSLLMVLRYKPQYDEKHRKRWLIAKDLLFNGSDPGLFPEKRSKEVQKVIAERTNIEIGTLLMYSSGQGRSEIVKKLLENPQVRASINTSHLFQPMEFLYEKRETTALLLAVEHGYLETMNLLLQANADPTLADSNGNTPLIKASYEGHIDIVRDLLKIHSVKEKVNEQNKKGETPYFLAKSKGHTEIMELLLSAGANKEAY